MLFVFRIVMLTLLSSSSVIDHFTVFPVLSVCIVLMLRAPSGSKSEVSREKS